MENAPDEIKDIRLFLGLAYAAQGKWKDLELLYHQDSREVTVADYSSNFAEPFAAILYLGRELLKYENLELAQKALQIAESLGNGSVEAKLLLAETHFRRRKYWESIALYEKMILLNPTSPQLLQKLGECYEKLGVREAARLCREKSLQLNSLATAEVRMVPLEIPE